MRWKMGVAAVLAAALACAGSARAAIDLTITYTGDDVVKALYKDGAAPVRVVLPTPGNNADWKIADSVTVEGLNHGDTYQFFFRVHNLDDAGMDNPAGFLAEISGHAISGYTSDLFTSRSWDYAVDLHPDEDDDSPPAVGWAAATEWAFYQTSSSSNGGDNFWTSNHGQIEGISGQARWIWGPHNGAELVEYEGENYLWLRATITTGLPEPSTLLIWSLLALSGMGLNVTQRRKRAGKCGED